MARKPYECLERNKKKYESAIKEYNEDLTTTISYLAKKYKCDSACLSKYMKKHGVEIRNIRGNHVSTEKARKLIEAKKLFEAGNSILSIAKEIGLAESTISKYLHSQGVQIDGRDKDRSYSYAFDENFFDIIDTEEKAYWYGFLMADGCVHLPQGKNTSYCVTLELSSVDEAHLEKMNKSLHADIPIKHRKDRPMSSIRLCSKHLALALAEKGCVPNKTYVGWIDPELFESDFLKKSFLRGYCDGNSYIDKKRYRIVYAIHSFGATKVLQDMLLSFGIKMKIKEEVQSKKGYRCYKLYCEDKSNFFKFLHSIYDNATIYLNRKYAIYKERTHK